MRLPALLIALWLIPGCTQQAAQTPQPPPKPPLEFLGEWGIPGSGPGQLSDPSGLAVDSVGNVHLSDKGSRFIHKFNPAGTPLLSFQNVSLLEPSCIALDRGDAIYVCDSKRRAVYVFYPTGDFLRVLRGREMLPSDVAVDAEGNVSVAGGTRVFQFTAKGRLGHSWGNNAASAGAFRAEDIQVSSDGSVYVLDADNVRVKHFSPQGEPVGEWSVAGSDAPSAFALRGDAMAVARPLSSLIEVWSLDGRRLFEVDVSAHFAPSRTESKEHIGALAFSPKGELFALVRSPERPRVLRFRVNF